MSNEVQNLVDAFNFTENQIREITYKTIEAGFVKDIKKHELLEKF